MGTNKMISFEVLFFKCDLFPAVERGLAADAPAQAGWCISARSDWPRLLKSSSILKDPRGII